MRPADGAVPVVSVQGIHASYGPTRVLDDVSFDIHAGMTVRAIADEAAVMRRGKVVEQGPKDVMFKPPHHPYTDLLLSSVPEMDPNRLATVLEERGVDNIGDAANV